VQAKLLINMLLVIEPIESLRCDVKDGGCLYRCSTARWPLLPPLSFRDFALTLYGYEYHRLIHDCEFRLNLRTDFVFPDCPY